jgi:hypothetical protein
MSNHQLKLEGIDGGDQCGWNKFRPYKMKRAYGSDPVGMVHVVATDFNPSDMNENKTIGIP